MLNVTQSFIPSLETYNKYLKRCFDNVWLTNRGELVVELEQKLKAYLDVPHITMTANGTLPLQIAIKALELKGEIITTPFSFVATTSAIVWENCTPIFVDIEPNYFTIDVSKIEAAITPKTSAILATHVFGNPCDIEGIDSIAKKHNLKVIYDGAHAFGVKYKGKSIFTYGDVSTCSFHATKIMHTGEGGAFFSNDFEFQKNMFLKHNFGHNGPHNFEGVGINAKMSELHAAMGLAVFEHIKYILESRKKAVDLYRELLKSTPIQTLSIRPETEWNYHYFPVIFDTEEELLNAISRLNKHKIFPRRYYYPSLNQLSYVSYKKMIVSEDFSKRILCLPLSDKLSEIEINKIVDITKYFKTH